ncbi:hypothetical protein K488DRAFT_87144 [Vararia minispora EC-137]|uniref:Uncharacterized protein n=1 Tax=Vararia minispora EC-137 TaxID=1314806 RepID=A0ACB8QGY6_9AGAM|nr:hypothetical protein K488DRAFT_87144 [Vararia minispora EC-137]
MFTFYRLLSIAGLVLSVNAQTKNVCGSICNTVCSNAAGNLPPISDDCQMIKNAVQIFQNNNDATFTVAPAATEELVFGTCSFFFTNLSNSTQVACWQDLANSASVSGAACFPPTMPLHSEGDCRALDGTWVLGYAPLYPGAAMLPQQFPS